MKIKDITRFLESLAPIATQESYDNSGLLVGSHEDVVSKALIALDCTEAIVDEAIANQCDIIIAHHPIVFGGLKKLNGKNYVERVVMKAIKHDIALYAIHTNLDNYKNGVNKEICNRLGLTNTRVLAPKSNELLKLVFFVPEEHQSKVLQALFDAGAGNIGNYSECAFASGGTGSFKPNDAANPTVGTNNQLETVQENRVEVVLPKSHRGKVLQALHKVHPYEEVAHELYVILNENQDLGAGMIGQLTAPVDGRKFLETIKSTFECGVVRHTKLLNKPIQTVAVCGGSGSFLLKKAIASGADLYVTADMKYHEFFDAEEQIVVADIGHYESEQFTSSLLADLLKKKFPKFALRLTGINTNPINYI